MKTLEDIFEIIEQADISIYGYTENGKLCGYELNTYTDAGTNEILFLDFRDEGKDAKNASDFIKEFESYINHYTIDDRIDSNRQGEHYRKCFTLKESLKDFTKFDKKLRKLLKKISKH